ncbi:SulP family inorganic anion transporter [Phenylobacterium sp. J367]|uniref:SulP family inorganic anion transporter n=1 Tax=Phenylobacterium sp. J367 TaxID=2898435 RepID=UPI002151B0F8|nr:SulP family inorganic anion transporter [Phenylobacterium sp. J367]MCR5880682.1 SulP family inorganic anion transporter [Phenylobacterium sp. J367]
MPDGASTADLYLPKLATVLREGYDRRAFRADAAAGLTVAVVALPLSMAIAVASGVSPERGLYAAIVGGALVSALGGSRVQIGGPAGAFIVLVASTAASLGLQGLLTAILLSGVMLALVGLSRLGSLVRHVPHAVTVGFTCAIAVVIAASQLKDFAGLRLSGPEPGAFFPKLAALLGAAPSVNGAAVGLGLAVVAAILFLRRLRPGWPGMLIAVAAAAGAAWALDLPVETISSRFGGIPRGLPAPALPPLSVEHVLRALPAALSFTLLGAVESLLSAKVADSMTGRRHRSNMELVAQGAANVGSALFGGLCVTGTIARTATNVRAGARSPVAGILHAVFLLGFMLLAAPLAGFIPLAALAGVLLVVCWTMAEKAEFLRLLRDWRTATVVLITFGVTVAHDLTLGIVAGCLAGAAFWLTRRPVPEEGALGRTRRTSRAANHRYKFRVRSTSPWGHCNCARQHAAPRTGRDMRTFSFLIEDRRYATPMTQFVIAADEQRARELALRELKSSGEHLAIEVQENGRTLFREQQAHQGRA